MSKWDESEVLLIVSTMTMGIISVGGDVDIVARTTKLGEQVAGNTKLEKRSFVYLPPMIDFFGFLEKWKPLRKIGKPLRKIGKPLRKADRCCGKQKGIAESR
jgi:hypothetical protein